MLLSLGQLRLPRYLSGNTAVLQLDKIRYPSKQSSLICGQTHLQNVSCCHNPVDTVFRQVVAICTVTQLVLDCFSLSSAVSALFSERLRLVALTVQLRHQLARPSVVNVFLVNSLQGFVWLQRLHALLCKTNDAQVDQNWCTDKCIHTWHVASHLACTNC